MMTLEATDLAKRIRNTWRGGPSLGEWVDYLTELDAGQAGTTLARLRRTDEHTPSIAHFHATYRTVHVHDASTRPRCGDCDGTGWVAAPDYERHGEAYTASRPCRCPEGQQRAESAIWKENR